MQDYITITIQESHIKCHNVGGYRQIIVMTDRQTGKLIQCMHGTFGLANIKFGDLEKNRNRQTYIGKIEFNMK